MAPSVYTGTAKEKTNMRKPVVEKMRRDRINKSIEQLKVLLKTEMKAHQPCSKLEKADVLEMAVIYLTRSARTPASPDSGAPAAQSYADGFSMCIRETARFLSVHNQLQTVKPALMKHFDTTQQPKESTKPVCPPITPKRTGVSGEQGLWRPW